MSGGKVRLPWYRVLYVQVLIAVVCGLVIGAMFPNFGKELKPLGDIFIKLIKMTITPIVFCTVVHGIASIKDLKQLGRVGLKSILYFEVISTLALVIGLVVVNTLKPGVGFTPVGEVYHVSEKAGAAAQQMIEKSHSLSVVDFATKLIPDTLFSAFTSGDLLQTLLISIFVGCALVSMKERGEPILLGLERASELFFGVMRLVVKLAPVGAFGAMAFTIGNFGWAALAKLGYLMLGFYSTAFLFVAIVLGSICRICGFSIWKYISYIKEELLLVLGTSSSETALPGLILKSVRLGSKRSTAGLVIPTGYSFNLDGTNIYMSMAAIFLAQATNTPLSISQQIGLLAVSMLTSKGASGVTGAGFITLAATLQAVPGIPLESLAILVGIDRFMSECRSLTNFIGNGVAALAISRWEGELSSDDIAKNLAEAHESPHY